ncbi:MAG: DUF3198 domain-containing protein [Thermoplasmatales archaeon]
MEKGKYKEFKIPISLVFIAVSLFFFVLTVIYFFDLAILPLGFQTLLDSAGGWSYYIFAISLIVLVYFLYLFVSTVWHRRKFEELIASDSKSVIVKNLRDLEYIAGKLGPGFVKRLQEKKEQLRIK